MRPGSVPGFSGDLGPRFDSADRWSYLIGMRVHRLFPYVCVFGMVFLTSQRGAAQGADPQQGGRTISLGQPGLLSWLAGVSGGINPSTDRAQARFGAYSSIGNQVVDGLGLTAEGYVGSSQEGEATGGLRGRLMLPIAGFGIGADHDLRAGRTNLILSSLIVGRRGGIVGRGSMLRIDYVPARDALSLGIELPVFRPLAAGRDRPRRDHVRLRSERMPALQLPAAAPEVGAAFDEMRAAAAIIRERTVPFLGRGMPERNPPFIPVAEADAQTTVEGETRRFHTALDRAFQSALNSEARGRAHATIARELLLDQVLLPYNRLLGQVKDPDSTWPLAANAMREFLPRVAGVEDTVARARSVGVFLGLLQLVEQERARISGAWGDSRFVWLPLQYALTPEQHDSQDEMDALVARAVEREFSEGNFASYVINEQFQYQLSRTIRAAEDYHIVWTHDFRGLDDVDDPDEMSYRHIVRSYLRAMTERVRAYDRTGRFPTYMVLHDQWYYSVRKGWLFLRLLEDPTRHRIKLAPGFEAWEDSIAAAQATLREAIAGSARLQADRARFGDDWLRNLVKVHVSVMNRPDPSYRSWRLARGVPMTDNILRDHRKMVIYDITEEDPYRGEAIFTGAGVGEHYSNLSWEDRALLVRGPALLSLKAEARGVLLLHGVPEDQIPAVLQPRPKPANYDQLISRTVEQSQWPLRAITIHNESGYDAKRVNVAKAVIYTLTGSGSVVMVPDSFWNAEFWGSALVGAALRGARVMVIAPSNTSNSVEVRGTQLLTRELLWRMLIARQRFAHVLATSGGALHIGVFDSKIAVIDVPGKVSAVRATFAQHAWLRDLFGFPQRAYDGLDQIEQELAPLRLRPVGEPEFEHDSITRLHLKANFVASREAWRIMERPEWGDILWSFITQRIAQVQSSSSITLDEYPDAILDVGTGYVADWHASLTPAQREKLQFYAIMGSQNQNYRSMVMDAEVAFVVSNWPSIIPYLDAISLIGQSHWIEDPAQLDALLPAMGRFITNFSHWGRLAF